MESTDITTEEHAHEELHESEPTKLSLWSETFRSMSTTAIVLGAVLIVLSILHPDLILKNNTPTGGDMGAHVWGPAYLRDVLLPHWRLTGWSMDWYAGLPSYRFYMVVSALFIVLLDTVLPYGVAFKIIVVSGLLAMPVCAYAMGKLAKLMYPLPELMVAGATLFLLDESFTIYGGNIASTMAGEFSHSIALAFAVIGLGVFARGLDDGKHRAWAAILIALAAVSHGIVLLFVFGGAIVMVALRPDKQRIKFGLTTLACAVMLSAFWVLPFLGGHAFMTDMKYGSEPGGGSFKTMWDMYFPLSSNLDLLLVVLSIVGFIASIKKKRHLGIWMGVYSIILMIGVKVAQGGLPIIGLLWNPRILPFIYLLRYMLAAIGSYEVLVYLRESLYLRKNTGQQVSEPSLNTRTSFLWVFVLASLLVVGVRYQTLPFASMSTSGGQQRYGWGPVNFSASRAFSDGWARWNFEGYEGKTTWPEYRDVVKTMSDLGKNSAHGCGRALWENSGDLNKYGTTMALMLLPYWTKGCISSMEGLYFEAAGTTPYHFIAAAALSKQSSNPVRELRYDNNDAAKGVAYMRLLGIRYFMGYTPEAIKAAQAQTDLIEVATSGPWHIFELADIKLVEPITVQPVVVNHRTGDQRERWLEVGSSYFQNSDEWKALPVADGPASWQRVNVTPDISRRVGEPGKSGRQVDIVQPGAITKVALDAVAVSNVKLNNESISFSVDKVGIPVLVNVSYFPNWTVKGASKVYRAAPNMMVVVPTSKNVKLSYEPSGTDKGAYVITLIGIIWVAFMFRRRYRYGVRLPALSSSVDEVLHADEGAEVSTENEEPTSNL